MSASAVWPEAMRRQLARPDALLLLGLCLLGFASLSWVAPLFDLDEGAFAQATLEMIASGNWLTTTLDGVARYDKPLLAYWLQALAVSGLGVTELAFRLPSILAACAWAFATRGFVAEVLRAEGRAGEAASGGLFAGASVALALMTGLIGHAATADALLNLWLALSFFELWRWLHGGRRAPLLRLYLWIGLGMLTKGPVAAILPLLAGLAYCALYRRWAPLRAALLEWRGWLLLFAVLGLWLLPLAWTGQLGFVWQFLLQHNLGRYTAPAEGHGGGLWFYLLWLPLAILPFSALLPRLGAMARGWRADPLLTLALGWALIVLLLFSLASTKLPHYTLYGCTPLFVLFGRAAPELRDRRLLLPGIAFVLLVAALPLWLPLLRVPPRHAFEAGILDLARQSIGLRYGAVALLAVGLCAYAWVCARALWQRLLLVGVAQAGVVWLGLMPVLFTAQQLPVREAALRARAAGTVTVAYRTYLPSFSVYRGAPTAHRLPLPGEWVFVRRDRVDRLRAELPLANLETEYQRGGVVLLRYVAVPAS